MSLKKHPAAPASHGDDLGLERLVFFSDAVMAIAITLLAIDLKAPELDAAVAPAELPLRLAEMGPSLMSFVISFAVIGVYWASHHRYFSYIKRHDRGLIALNMLFLLFIVLMPFASRLLGQYGYLPLGVIAYAGAVGLIGLSVAAIWGYATFHHRLVDEHLDAAFIRTRGRIALAVPLLFLLSIPLAWVSPLVAMASWWVAPLLAYAILRVADRGQGKQHARHL